MPSREGFSNRGPNRGPKCDGIKQVELIRPYLSAYGGNPKTLSLRAHGLRSLKRGTCKAPLVCAAAEVFGVEQIDDRFLASASQNLFSVKCECQDAARRQIEIELAKVVPVWRRVVVANTG